MISQIVRAIVETGVVRPTSEEVGNKLIMSANAHDKSPKVQSDRVHGMVWESSSRPNVEYLHKEVTSLLFPLNFPSCRGH